FPIIILLGFLFVMLFQVIAYSSQKIDISTTTIANKITFIFPTIMGILFFKEPWNYLKIIGFSVAIASIILSAENKRKFPKIKTYFVLLILFFGGGFLEILLSYSQKFLIVPADTSIFFGYLFLFAFIFGVFILLWKVKNGQKKPSQKDILWGLILGIPNYFSMYFLLDSLNDLPSSSVFPIANMGVILCSTLFSIVLFQEKLSKKKSLALLCSILAILFISFYDIF
ncbi:MAG: EamA family transporter, partial [Flavobacteriales bacterium]